MNAVRLAAVLLRLLRFSGQAGLHEVFLYPARHGKQERPEESGRFSVASRKQRLSLLSALQRYNQNPPITSHIAAGAQAVLEDQHLASLPACARRHIRHVQSERSQFGRPRVRRTGVDHRHGADLPHLG